VVIVDSSEQKLREEGYNQSENVIKEAVGIIWLFFGVVLATYYL